VIEDHLLSFRFGEAFLKSSASLATSRHLRAARPPRESSCITFGLALYFKVTVLKQFFPLF